jgi:long-chain acyl-CoA synthetase
MPEETTKTLKDGWLYSGDTGFIDEDGHLVVFDRTKDIMILTDGRKFSPQFLEARLKFSPYLRDALIVGHERPYVTAILCIDYNTVGKWAEDHGINYTSYPELSQNPAVYDLVEKPIREVNRTLPDAAKITRFANLYKEFDADDDELTRTRKIRRAFVENRYKNIIDKLYSGENMLHMETNITYEDGRVAEIKQDIKLQDVSQQGGKK